MDKVLFPYRSNSHLALLHVIGQSGSWEKHGLDVEYNRHISSTDAHDAVMSGDVDFIGGNHVSPYASRARGDKWVYLGQTLNTLAGRKLVVRPDSGINGISDLRHKVVGARGSHPRLNDWLQLKQHGLDADKDEVSVIDQLGPGFDPVNPRAEEETEPLWHWVRDRKVDAAFINVPGCIFAEMGGLRLIDVPAMPMIYFTTVSTSLTFAEKHPDIVERFLKGMLEGIAFFKTEREKTIDILKQRYTKEGSMSATIAEATYDCYAQVLEPKLYPAMDAIANVYAEGVYQDKDAAQINPMELWDLHYLRKLDDSGFVKSLYQSKASAAR